MRKFRHGDYLETERKTRVKMYKAGKSWVKSCLSQFGLLRFFGKSPVIEHIESSQVEENASTDKKEYLFKGLTALGALAGGAALTTPQVNADELPKEKVLEKETLVNTDSAALKAAESTTESVQESELTQEASEHIDQSASASISASESASISESISISESESLSVSESQSASESSSVSSSESASTSVSESASTSASESESDTSQGSESVADHEGKVADDESASRSQNAPRVANENKAAIENVPAVQNDGGLRSATSSENTYEVNGVDLPEVPVNNFVARTTSDAAELAGAGSLNQGKTKAEVDRQASDLQTGLERSTTQEDDRSKTGYYAAVSHLSGNKAQVKEDLEKALAHNDGAASDLASYKSRIDAANTIEEIGAVVAEAQAKYPNSQLAPEESAEERAQKEAQLNSAKSSAKTSAQAILDARAQANNSQATDADPAHVAAVQAKIDAAQSTAEVDKIITDLNDSASADTILVPKTDQDGRRYFEDIDTGKKYYLEPNWNEDSIKGQNSTRWELEPGQQLRVINNPSEPLSVQQLKYKGFHETADGDQVIDMMYTFTPRSAYVWNRLNLRISDDLQKRIDWTKSYYEDRNGNVYRFINGSQANDKIIVLNRLDKGTETKRSPIRLYLRDNVTREELDTIDTTIQSRLLDANGNVYTKYMGGTNDSNMSLTGYGSYTQSVTIPKTTSTNLKSGLNPYLQVISSVDQAPDFVSSQNTVSYNPSENKLYVASQFHKKDTDNRNEKLNGQSIAYRLAFDKELLDVLKEDDYGYIGYVEPSVTSGMKGAVNPNNVRTGFTRNQVNVVGDMAYVIYAPNEFDYNDETGQIIYANKGTQGFIDNISTEMSGQQFTLTTLNIDSDNLKKLYPTINNQQPEMTAISVHSAMIIENDHGIDRVKMTTDQEAVARQGDKIEIRFAKPTNHGVKRSDLIDGEILYWDESAAKLAMKAGEAPIIGHLGVYPASRGARGSDARYDFDVNANSTVYTYTLPHDFKLAAGSEISLYTGANGKLVDNSGEVYINGVKVAEFGPDQAETSYAPRLIIGTEVNSSALLDRTQYMPVVKDMYDFDKVITGYTYVPNQLVEISYIDANSGQTRYVRTMSGNTAEPGASYTVEGDKTYPEPGKGLYKFEYAIPDTDRVVKDSPIVARSFNYQSAKDAEERALAEDEEAIQTSVGSDAVIARVLIQVTYDLNQPNGTSARRVMTYAAPAETTDAAGNTTAIENSDVPRNEDFSNEVGYTNNGLAGNMANDPTLEGYRFLGWNTAQDGSGDFVTPETAFQNSTTVYAQWEKVSMSEEFEPGYDNISVEEGQADTVAAPTFIKNGQVAHPEVSQFTTSVAGVTVNADGSITVPASFTEGKAGQKVQIPVTITYADNTTDTANVYVDVTRKPENELYEPSVTPVEKDYGQAPTQDEIKNAVTVPGYEENPAYPGQTPTVTIDDPNALPDGNTPGDHKVPVAVTYPDGTEDKETVTVTVKPQPENDKYQPSVTPINKDYGHPTSEEEIKNSVTVPGYEENPDYPGQTPTVTVDDPTTLPDGNTPGDHTVPVTVTYPDGTEDKETVTVTVKPQPENDKYQPSVTPINKDYGQPTTEDEIKNAITVPDYEENPSYPGQTPTVTVDNPGALPDGNTPGDHEVPVTVTYPDGTEDKETVTVTVKPQPENDKYQPSVTPINKDYGQPITEDEIMNAVTVPGFEENPSYPGQTPMVTIDDPTSLPDGNTPGDHTVPVTVTYPDGTEDKETVTVTVKPQPENDKYTPEVAPVEKDYGQAPTEDEIKGAVTVPGFEENPSYPGQRPTVTIDDSSTLPDGNTPGDYTVPVTVTYPDGTEDKETVTVTVKPQPENDKYQPSVTPVEKDYGQAPTEDEIKEAVTVPAYEENSDYPGQTPTVTIDDPSTLPDGKTPGVHEVPVTVEYPDGTKDPVTVKVVVNKSNKDTYQPSYPQPTVTAGETSPTELTPSFTANVPNDPNDPTGPSHEEQGVTPPAGTKFSINVGNGGTGFATADGDQATIDPNTGVISFTPGSNHASETQVSVPVKVTYPDGTSDEVTATVTVKAQPENDKYEPSVTPVEKDYGEPATENDVTTAVTVPGYEENPAYPGQRPTVTVDDPSTLPDGNTPGNYTVPVTVTYPDGTKDQADVTVTVKMKDKAVYDTAYPAVNHAESGQGSITITPTIFTEAEIQDPAYPNDPLKTVTTKKAMSDVPTGTTFAFQDPNTAGVTTTEVTMANGDTASINPITGEITYTPAAGHKEDSVQTLPTIVTSYPTGQVDHDNVTVKVEKDNDSLAESASNAESESAHSLSEAMSQAASASAYSTSVTASESAHSASVATSEAVSQVASTSVAASESAHSASVATSEAVSQVASTSVAASQSAHSASVATSEAVSQVASTSVAASESAHSASVAASESAHSGSVAASQSAHSLSVAMSQAASASAYSTSVANSESAYSASVATSEAVSQVASTFVAASESAHSLSEAMSQAASASAYSTSVANSESAHSASVATSEAVSQVASTSVAASESAHTASVAASESAHSGSVAASQSAHSLSEAMSQAASASAYSTSVANSESAYSASVATSEAVSQVASTSVAASESTHSLSEAMSQVASASAYSTSVANSESAHSASVATSEAVSQVASTSVAASESAHSASVATSEAVSQVASTSVAASESTHSLSEAMSQAASASAYSTSVANSESAHSASVATSEAVSQVASTSVAASESTHSLSEAMSQAASASAYSTSVANSESAHSASIAASESTHSLSEAMSQAASASAYSTSVANSESAHSASVAASESAHSASVATSEAVSQVASTSVAASESTHSLSEAMSQAASASAYSTSVANSESAHSASVATSEAVSQVASTSVAASESTHSLSEAMSQAASASAYSTSVANSESAHSASVAASESANSASIATSEAVSQVASTSVAASESAHSASAAISEAVSQVASTSVAASESAHSASVATSEALSQVASTSEAASASAYSTSVANSESAHSASVATSEAVSQVASTSVATHILSEAMSQAASASAYSTSVANSESAHSASVATSEVVSQVASTSVAASESTHSLSEAMSQAASASAYSTSVANSESAHSASVATSEAVSQVASTSVAASESAHSASVATSEAVSQVASMSVAASESAHSLSEAMSEAASASAYSTSVANSESAHSASVAASQSAHSLSEAMSQAASASAYSTSVANSESAHSAPVAASQSAYSLSETMSQAASASAYSTSVANSESTHSASVAASESAHSASVATSEAVSQVASTSIATSQVASELAHSLSEAMSQAASASAYSTSVAHSESTHSLSVAMSETISEHVSLSELDSRSDSQLASQLTSTSIEQSATISEQNSVIASLLSETQSQAPTSESDSSSEVHSHGPGWIESELPEFDIESFSASLSASESESLEASISASQSESASVSLSQTVSTSESISLSESASISASQSASLDHVAPDSESDYHSGSEDSTASEASSSEVTSTRDEFSESAGVTPPTIIDSSHSGSAIDSVDSASASSSASQSDQASLIASDERRPSKQNAVAKPSAHRQQSVATNQVLPKTGAVSPLLTPGLLFVFAGLGIVSKKRKEK
ncbi:accessory Sec-dependent serine-rich glycoprotein adhesin [Aerococcus sp. CDC-944-U94]|uniref:accessory Sec-dependent serine-rich glycoprotein adhesin n=1 Tax=Aerococcus urinae (strain CCUG 59500 / ACS-120-V-Col10a) TaxID=2976812 RepID=UPI00227CA3EC|nr:accessory Sec-dependent serine-rich glycoprotein adhesin [Aerococcus sp. Group 1]MCY3054249.1 accessory Sec-dependent serine-rich glycoprotein adhesin [Aerococcus sp. Group 1]MCY3055979.1 accessory Sec-dependent serine-rich glycoprotein adhesin [Aerococcus sp. Group 1]